MEELWNSIDRFLGDEDFHDRLCDDAGELHQLLTECNSLYPKKIAIEDQTRYDQAIAQTTSAAKQLLHSLQAGDYLSARDALKQLSKHRQKAHAEFSH